MEKIVKNIDTLLSEVQTVLLKIKAYKDVNKIFLAFFEKVEKLLLKEQQNDLMQAFEAMYKMVESQELSHQQKYVHHLSCIISAQTIMKLGEAIDIAQKKSALGQIIKTFISSKIQSLSLGEGDQFKRCLLILSYISIGFPVWKKSRDHVPELYSGITFILSFLQKSLIVDTGSEGNSDRQRMIGFDDLFEKVILNNEKNYSKDQLLAFLRISIAFVNNSFKITNMESNFDFLYQPILYQLKDILENGKAIGEELKNYLSETINKISEWIENFSYKSELNVLIEKPLIKIRQLDPRIIEKGQDLNKFIEKSKIKKKIKNATNKMVKEIRSDQAVIDKKKQEDLERITKDKDQARKKFVTIMDNQALEIKRIKTTQINFDRNKKKKVRLAGNKTAS